MLDAAAGGTHVWPVRVYYEDTDAAGIVYYANYLRFAERARTEMLRDLGGEHRALLDAHGMVFAVRSCKADYLVPARLDDALEVRSRLLEVGGASMTAEQVVHREAEVLVRMEVRLACMGRDGRAVRMPAPVRSALRAFQEGR
ncbi:MAG: tol-pal system-associated acyl-CoA thioesterase [Alphaproteobacteria bacterium]